MSEAAAAFGLGGRPMTDSVLLACCAALYLALAVAIGEHQPR